MLKLLWCFLWGHKWEYQYATQAKIKEDYTSDKHEWKLRYQGHTTTVFICSCCGRVKKIITVGHAVNLKEHFVRAIMES